MKTLKYISASVLALGLAGSMSAAGLQVLRTAGSSAFRSATVTAQLDVCSFNSTGAADTSAVQVAAAKGDAKADSRSIIHGWLNDGDGVTPGSATEVYFENNWTGSAAGVIDLANGNTTLKWYDPATTTWGTIAAPYNISTGVAPTDLTGAPSVAMSDVSAGEVAKAVSTTPVGAGFATTINSLVTAGTLKDSGTTPGPVAAATFQWVLGTSSVAAPFTNITQQQANALITNGAVALNVFTGNTADAVDFVFFVGRNEDSGTRITYQAESQQQPQFGGTAQQWMLQQDGNPVTHDTYPTSNAYASLVTGTSITGLKLWPRVWPVNTISTLNWNLKGHSGYNGGGDVVAILNTPNPVTGFSSAASGTSQNNTDLPAAWVNGTSRAFFISCLGTSDAAKVVGTNSLKLSYNGVAFTKPDATSGKYSLYSIEHAYKLTSATGTQVVAPSVADKVADKLNTYNATQIGAAGIPDPLVGRRAGTGAFVF